MVRSITQRCFPRLFCGFDATSAMWARMPRLRRLNTDGSVVVGLVGVELERAAGGGAPRMRWGRGRTAGGLVVGGVGVVDLGGAAGPGPTPLIGATLSRTSS